MMTLLLAGPVAAPAQMETAQVEIRAHGFSAPSVTVKPGTTVTWINHDDDAHTVTSTVDTFHSPGLDTDEKFSYTFTKPGTYEYFCTLHPLMTGKVIVTPERS
jgi:plastocyanin